MTETPRFSWSYTAITDFLNCPLMYAHKRFYKDVQDEVTEHLVEGNRVHKALERALLGEPTLPEHEDVVRNHSAYVGTILRAAEGGELLVEHQMAITEGMTPTDWFSKDAWGRGIIDCCVIKGDTAYIYDWKTGKVKDDDLQLKMFCAFLSIFRPEVKQFVAKFIWLKFRKVTGFSKPFPTTGVPTVWSTVLGHVKRMQSACQSEVFQARPSGLCPWCPYKERCEYKR